MVDFDLGDMVADKVDLFMFLANVESDSSVGRVLGAALNRSMDSDVNLFTFGAKVPLTAWEYSVYRSAVEESCKAKEYSF